MGAVGPRNAKIEKIEANPVVFVRDPNQLHVLIESKGLANAPASLIIEKRKDGGVWEEAARQQIILEEAGRVQTVPFDFKEDAPAKLEFRARLTDVGPELTTDDNVATAEVRVIRQKIKVLFIAGSIGSLNEFTIAYDEGKVIGCLTGTGGVADEIERLVSTFPKVTEARVFYVDDPACLLDACFREAGQ